MFFLSSAKGAGVMVSITEVEYGNPVMNFGLDIGRDLG